jgi:hypothetical protein
VCGGRVRVQKNRGFLAYLCVDGFHVSRREDYVNAVIEGVTVARLQQPDALDLLTTGGDEAVSGALAEVAEKQARLDGFYDEAAAGRLTPAALARIEARLLPEIEAAERRAHRATVPAVVAATAGPDAAARWARLTLPQRRQIIDTLMTVRILPTGRGARTFRPEDVEIVWKGGEAA